MDYRLDIGDEASAQLSALPREQRRKIGHRLDALQHGLQGDVQKLAGKTGKYRLRVGDYRVLFSLEKDLIFVQQVKHRKMPTATKRTARDKPTLRRLTTELARLRARVEDLEDLRDLEAAIVRNAGKPGIPWAKVKKELGLA